MKTQTLKYHFRLIFLILFIWNMPFPGNSQNFPPLSMVIEDSATTQGYFFLTAYTTSPPYIYDHAQQILDQFGRIVFYRIFPSGLNPNVTIDFKLQPNGQMSYFNTNREKHFIMDSTFTVVDSIGCANGFKTNQHDLQILPDNHFLLIGDETRNMNLSSYNWFGPNHNTPGGTNAQVFGVVIQEFNENKELIWEWKGHDHYQFGDVDPVYLFSPNKVDWTHANAVERDLDGNILLSLRHFNEITKIDRSTGNFVWRMGGKRNQFTFPNDSIRFTGQHDIRRVSDTSVSLYDNGQFTNPQMTRALEYSLDESNKIATLAWEYVYDTSMYSVACGNHQYIGNGNHLVDFGFTYTIGSPWMVVVKPDKTKVLEVHFPTGYISYRAFNYVTLPWQLKRPNVTCQKIGSQYYLVAESGQTEYRWSTGDTTSSIQITGPGEYWVFVPYGTGYISSEHIVIINPSNLCFYLDVPSDTTPHEISLRCMPNPSTGRTRIMFNLPSNSAVTISLTSLPGISVREPIHGYYPAGKHEITLDVSSLGRGIYFLSMEADNTRIVRKLIVQ